MGCRVGARATEESILPGNGAQIKNQGTELELSLKCETGAGAIAIWEVAPAPTPFLDINGFVKLTCVCSL